jgi:hypothetical protein
MDSEPTRLTQNDVGMVSRRFIRLDGYQPVGGIGGSEYHVEFRLRGDKAELFIVREGQLSGLVDRFLQLVSLLTGNPRIDRVTEQAANAVFHGLGGQLEELLRAGRRNTKADCDRLTPMGNEQRPRMPESDGSGTSNASVPTPICSPQDYGFAVSEEGRLSIIPKEGDMPPGNS